MPLSNPLAATVADISSVQNALYGAAGIAAYPNAAAAANDVSLAEVLRYIQEQQTALATAITTAHPRYLSVTADLTNATWNTDAKHEVFTVTGTVRMRMWITCTSNVGSAGGTAVLMFGTATDTDAFIASTDETEIDAGDLWYDATPTTQWDTFGNCVMDYVVSNGIDVGYEIDTEACDAGALVFHCIWEPMDATGAVVAGAGGAL